MLFVLHSDAVLLLRYHHAATDKYLDLKQLAWALHFGITEQISKTVSAHLVEGPSERTMNGKSKVLPFYMSSCDIRVHLFTTTLRGRHLKWD